MVALARTLIRTRRRIFTLRGHVPSLLIKFNAGCECDARRAQPERERKAHQISGLLLWGWVLGCYMEMGSLICARDHEMHWECVACVLETRRNALLATLLLIIQTLLMLPHHFLRSWLKSLLYLCSAKMRGFESLHTFSHCLNVEEPSLIWNICIIIT
jgi:hypothetical protein